MGAQLVENNERLLELRPGGWQGQWRGKDGDRRDGKNFGGNKFGGNRRGGGHHRGGDRDQNGPGKFGERIKFSDRGYSNNKFGDNKNNDRKPRTFSSNNRE